MGGIRRVLHPPLATIDSETVTVLGLLDAPFWTRDGKVETSAKRRAGLVYFPLCRDLRKMLRSRLSVAGESIGRETARPD